MDVARALDQIAEIHQQIAKGEVYRGYRPLPVALSGAIGLAAAALQPRRLDADPIAFLTFWLIIAAAAGLIGSSEIIYNYVAHDEAPARRHTRRVVGQFVPSVAAGAVLALCFARIDPRLVALLPGVWALCFGLGTLACRPYLPRASAIVAVFYCAAGVALLSITGGRPLTGWWVGGTFGAGQLLAAVVLRLTLERTTNR